VPSVLFLYYFRFANQRRFHFVSVTDGLIISVSTIISVTKISLLSFSKMVVFRIETTCLLYRHSHHFSLSRSDFIRQLQHNIGNYKFVVRALISCSHNLSQLL